MVVNSIPSFSQEKIGIVWIHFVQGFIGANVYKLAAVAVALPMS